jgi:hypothetical protein
LNGTYVPFSKDAAERAAKNDPRPSIAERYVSKNAYIEKFKAAAVSLRNEGFLLDEDVERLMDRARKDPGISDLTD